MIRDVIGFAVIVGVIKFELAEARLSRLLFGDPSFLKDWRRRYGEHSRRDCALTRAQYDAYCWRSIGAERRRPSRGQK